MVVDTARTRGQVEKWLVDLEIFMKLTVRLVIEKALGTCILQPGRSKAETFIFMSIFSQNNTF